ncbi:Uncharacterised protein [Mycobacteroides abscessus subsp. abscessus]|nr:Uncharacterised protein [Mycobacteroides abscessus subsp. abscessus]
MRSSWRTTTTDWETAGSAVSAPSISPSSMRRPRSFTWKSVRPRYSSSPSAVQATRSPVRYMRTPYPNGSATKRSVVRSGRVT